MFEKEAEEYADKYKPNFVVNEHGSTAGILAKGEEEVTRRWLMQFI